MDSPNLPPHAPFDPVPETGPEGYWHAPLWPRGVMAALFMRHITRARLGEAGPVRVPFSSWKAVTGRFEQVPMAPHARALAKQGRFVAAFQDGSAALAWADPSPHIPGKSAPSPTTCTVLPVVLERDARPIDRASLKREHAFWESFARRARVAWTSDMPGIAPAWGPYGMPGKAKTAFLDGLLAEAHAWIEVLCGPTPGPFDLSAYGRPVDRDGTIGPMAFVWSHQQQGGVPARHHAVRAAAIAALQKAVDRPDAPTFGRGGIWQDEGIEPRDPTGATLRRHTTPPPSAHARLQRALAFAHAHGLPMDAHALPPVANPTAPHA